MSSATHSESATPLDVEHRWTLFTTRELCDIAHALRMLRGYSPEDEAGFTRLANEAWGEHVRRVENGL